MKPAIIVPAFSRAKSLSRLLKSINHAHFPSDDQLLIITLDGGASIEVLRTAESFQFKHGIKKIIKREKNIGLRNHILWCGDQSNEYGSVIILEDDLLVDKYFYSYAISALKFYREDPEIGGISLYGQRFNTMAKLAFEPMFNGYSAYFMKLPSSWGQAWTADQWARFKEWYKDADQQQVNENENIPQTIKNWPETSWKKYYAAYLAEENLYFVYPYQSYTTNCADPGGVHMEEGTNVYQVPLGAKDRPEERFRFCSLHESTVKYDAFMDPEADEIYERLNLSTADLEIDIHGIKPVSLLKKKKFTLTPKKCKNPISTFRMTFRPIEKTVLNPVLNAEIGPGYNEYIFLSESENVLSEKRPFYEQVNYYSYYQTKRKYFLRRYLLHLGYSFLDKLTFWKRV